MAETDLAPEASPTQAQLDELRRAPRPTEGELRSAIMGTVQQWVAAGADAEDVIAVLKDIGTNYKPENQGVVEVLVGTGTVTHYGVPSVDTLVDTGSAKETRGAETEVVRTDRSAAVGDKIDSAPGTGDNKATTKKRTGTTQKPSPLAREAKKR